MATWVHLDILLIKKETDKAFLCVIDGAEEDVWIPKSQCSDPDDYAEGDTNLTLSVTEFIAKEKGLE